ncbi:hypothetical protein [Yinghuangia seranimata]|uniref:hypothetical protein n=1 Tax=Yinghuangia seranimata TaxID=408067 RepID=UPI00248ACF08|nr:hypothetical protein [Yinghuangia seranimata]MDI2130717.1 hypothetical protein [Yinghuangia seranimata]
MWFEVCFGERELRLSVRPEPAALPSGIRVDLPGHLRRREIPAEWIRDADGGAFPPEIRTMDGETLFVPRSLEGDLAAFCARNGIAMRARYDVWGDLLEPYLDTEFTVSDEQAAAARLAAVGLDSAAVEAVRQRVGPAVYEYNFNVPMWDDFHLGLADLLDTYTARWAGEAALRRLGPPYEVYVWAMRIAELGRGG